MSGWLQFSCSQECPARNRSLFQHERGQGKKTENALCSRRVLMTDDVSVNDVMLLKVVTTATIPLFILPCGKMQKEGGRHRKRPQMSVCCPRRIFSDLTWRIISASPERSRIDDKIQTQVGSNITIHFLYISLFLIWQLYLYIIHC